MKMKEKIKYILLSVQDNLISSLVAYGLAYVILYVPITLLESTFGEISDRGYYFLIACLISSVIIDIAKDVKCILLEKKGSAEESKRKVNWNDTKKQIKIYIDKILFNHINK